MNICYEHLMRCVLFILIDLVGAPCLEMKLAQLPFTPFYFQACYGLIVFLFSFID